MQVERTYELFENYIKFMQFSKNKNIKIVLTNEKKRVTIMTTTKKAKDKQKTTCQETRNPGRIEKSQRQGCKRN